MLSCSTESAATPSPRPTPASSPVLEASPTPSAEPAPSPSPSPTPAGLTLSGVISTHIEKTVADGRCGNLGPGFYANFGFDYDNSQWSLTISIPIPGYHGPSSYGTPPSRVTIHRTHTLTPLLYAGISGTVTVAADEKSGSVEERLRSPNGIVEVSGDWSC